MPIIYDDLYPYYYRSYTSLADVPVRTTTTTTVVTRDVYVPRTYYYDDYLVDYRYRYTRPYYRRYYTDYVYDYLY